MSWPDPQHSTSANSYIQQKFNVKFHLLPRYISYPMHIVASLAVHRIVQSAFLTSDIDMIGHTDYLWQFVLILLNHWKRLDRQWDSFIFVFVDSKRWSSVEFITIPVVRLGVKISPSKRSVVLAFDPQIRRWGVGKLNHMIGDSSLTYRADMFI